MDVSDQYKEIKHLCLHLMARREHSQKELLLKLQAKGFSRQDCEQVVAECTENGWQDDFRYAESYARQRMEKGYGSVRIAYELAQKGVPDFDLQALARDEYGSWFSILEKLYRKKYNDETVISRKEWAKRTRFLLQRGFSAGLISQLFDHLKIKFD